MTQRPIHDLTTTPPLNPLPREGKGLLLLVKRKDYNMQRKEIVSQISDAIKGVAPTATAILYGSEARGEARPDSDIDVLILLDGDHIDLKREMAVTDPLWQIEWKTGIPISPTVMLRSQWEQMPFKTPFYLNVVNEGKEI